ncbi:hypothetical protein M885DRAFT_534416 [Pelagophyceae sp. CCMP2097]|nr:hypothetical protein M885DRAFT_534416 [Pelagophyceae sp. CCMP2097]|mmetsp:Transcript_9794/g.32262  ORF Transcript_9794/g.32262 Transcript_9794/m.32262 type:complete len:234 (-) Transcript_9794:116-817(-)
MALPGHVPPRWTPFDGDLNPRQCASPRASAMRASGQRSLERQKPASPRPECRVPALTVVSVHLGGVQATGGCQKTGDATSLRFVEAAGAKTQRRHVTPRAASVDLGHRGATRTLADADHQKAPRMRKGPGVGGKHTESSVDSVVFGRDLDCSGEAVDEFALRATRPFEKPARGHLASSVDDVVYGRDMDNSGVVLDIQAEEMRRAPRNSARGHLDATVDTLVFGRDTDGSKKP